MINVKWSEFKAYIDSSDAQVHYIEDLNNYRLYAINGMFQIHCILSKGKDAEEFEQNYKAASNFNTAPSAFASKKLSSGKSLFSRVHGKSFNVSAGSNTLVFEIPYNQVKFNELEILGGELGDRANLKILDSVNGTYTTVPNYQLNQFGFLVAVAKDYYKRKSNYDADLMLNMQIEITYESQSAKNIYINYILHELK